MRRSFLITACVLAFLVVCISGTAQVALRTFALEAQDPAFWSLISRDTKLETIASGFRFTEGPMWDPGGFLYVSDEKGVVSSVSWRKSNCARRKARDRVEFTLPSLGRGAVVSVMRGR